MGDRGGGESRGFRRGFGFFDYFDRGLRRVGSVFFRFFLALDFILYGFGFGVVIGFFVVGSGVVKLLVRSEEGYLGCFAVGAVEGRI